MANITPKEKILAVYNVTRVSDGLQPLTLAEVDFGTPEPYSGSRSAKTTRLYITPKASSTNTGRSTVYYNRINLATVTSLAIVKGAAIMIEDVLPQISDEMGITLVVADITNAALPSSGGFTLTASAANLMYTGAASVAYAT